MMELWEGEGIIYSAAAVYVWTRNTPGICVFAWLLQESCPTIY